MKPFEKIAVRRADGLQQREMADVGIRMIDADDVSRNL